jgi:hypothetical protein
MKMPTTPAPLLADDSSNAFGKRLEEERPAEPLLEPPTKKAAIEVAPEVVEAQATAAADAPAAATTTTTMSEPPFIEL